MPQFLNRILAFALVGASVCAAAGSAPSPEKTKKTQVAGYLVDVSCSHDEAEAGPGWGQKHTRACLLMPACVRSGYAVLTDSNEVVRFDAKGNQQAHKLILAGTQNKDWRVRVRGQRAGDEFRVSTIELIK